MHRQDPKPAKRWLSTMGRLALIVSVWNAPFPLVHAHDADVHDRVSATTLVGHLTHYHPDVSLNSHIDFGWHWHMVLPPANHPGDESPDGKCPGCPQDSRDTQPQVQQTTAILQFVCAWSVVTWSLHSPQLNTCVARSTATHFLDTYLGSVSLGTLLRVARC